MDSLFNPFKYTSFHTQTIFIKDFNLPIEGGFTYPGSNCFLNSSIVDPGVYILNDAFFVNQNLGIQRFLRSCLP